MDIRKKRIVGCKVSQELIEATHRIARKYPQMGTVEIGAHLVGMGLVRSVSTATVLRMLDAENYDDYLAKLRAKNAKWKAPKDEPDTAEQVTMDDAAAAAKWAADALKKGCSDAELEEVIKGFQESTDQRKKQVDEYNAVLSRMEAAFTKLADVLGALADSVINIEHYTMAILQTMRVDAERPKE